MFVAVQVFVPGLYRAPVFKMLNDASSPPQTIISLPVHIAVWLPRPVGALVMPVAVQLSVFGLYLPPVSKTLLPSSPPQTIISLPVHTAECPPRAEGALVVSVATQLSVLGLYLPPVLKSPVWLGDSVNPPHTIISVPV